MRLTRRTAIVVAVVCAFGAAVLTFIYLRSLRTQAVPPPRVEKITIPVLLQTAPAGTTLTESMLTVKEVALESLPADVIRDSTQLLGQRLFTQVTAGTPLLRSQLAAYSSGAGLSFAVPPGLRAVTIAVDNISGVGGFLSLGDRVDVLATFEAAGSRIITRTVLQDVQVLAVGPTAAKPQPQAGPAPPKAGEAAKPPEAEPPKATSVTLAVTPTQAQLLVLSSSKGGLHLALRAKNDSAYVALPAADNVGSLGVDLGPPPSSGATPPPPAGAPPAVGTVPAASTPSGPALAPAKPRPTVEVIRGGQRETVTP